ncbi:MAG: F0F1 ATP synthase subunit delta [Actinomycetota bacterium]|nr:F0F1 ATP synthase subunit delta [Actinomycetota bacterium]
MAETVPRAFRVARERAEEAFARAAEADALGRVRDELFALADLLRSQATLRRALSDISVPAEAREALLRDLLSGRVDEHTLDLLVELARVDTLAWRLPAILEDLAVQAVLAEADHDGSLPDVEDELFRFSRLVESNPRLRSALTDPVLPDESKRALLDDLLAGRVSVATLTLVHHAIARPGDPVEAIQELADRAAARRDRVVVEARTAVPLDGERRQRLAAALARAVGRQVDLEVTVDPSIVGGVVARMGDEVIDGSIRRKLELARERLTS